MTDRAAVLRSAQDFVDSRRFVEALALCERLLKEGEDAAALRVKGLALAGMRAHDLAVEVLTRACTRDPRDAAAFLALGLSLRALERMDEALAALDEAVRLDPVSTDARTERGSLRRTQGDEKGAMIDFEAAQKLMPESPAKTRAGESLRELAATEGYRASPLTEALEYARTAYALGVLEHCLEFIGRLGPGVAGVPALLHLKALCLAGLGRKAEARGLAADPLLASAMTPEMRRELDEALGAP